MLAASLSFDGNAKYSKNPACICRLISLLSIRLCVLVKLWLMVFSHRVSNYKLIGWAFEYVVRDNFNWNWVIYIYYALEKLTHRIHLRPPSHRNWKSDWTFEARWQWAATRLSFVILQPNKNSMVLCDGGVTLCLYSDWFWVNVAKCRLPSEIVAKVPIRKRYRHHSMWSELCLFRTQTNWSETKHAAERLPLLQYFHRIFVNSESI